MDDDPLPDPSISWADVESTCEEPLPSAADAEIEARQLRRSGWVVPEQPRHPHRPDGSRWYGGVFHPRTWESPGDLTYRDSPDHQDGDYGEVNI